MKKKALLFFFYIFALAVLYLFCEGITRLLLPQIKPQGTDKNLIVDNMYYNSHGLKSLSSGYSNGALVKIDQYGFREFKTKVDTTKKSLLLLGDSVTMGIGVEADSTFAGRLQSELDSVNILNPSVVGYAIEDYENLAKHFIVKEGNKLNISKIFVCWCLNDLYFHVPDFETPGGSLRYLFGDLLKFIRTRSRFYMFVKTQFFDRPKTYYLFDEKFYSTEKEEFIQSIRKIESIKNLCQIHQIEFEILLLPYEYQIRNAESILDQPQKLMKDKLAERGVKVLDAANYLAKRKVNSTQLFLYGDGIHFSDAGHRLIVGYIIKNVMFSTR
ncbi:hypothetical protein B6I21_05800 [candidate division KSB1 bacterium 4572_119]|nr:MAG: hypothetical protein B6I21_05800 [candidate division KSB1 bacterium 4572_119]